MPWEVHPEYPVSRFVAIVGKTVARVDEPEAGEGLRITFTDGFVFEVRFSATEGEMEFTDPRGREVEWEFKT